MKKHRFSTVLIGALLLVVAVAAAAHLTSRIQRSEGSLQITYNGSAVELPLGDFSLSPVQGTVKNAKGDSRRIDAQGIPVSDILAAAGIDGYQVVTVVADDEYRAEISAEEVSQADRVYLLCGEAPLPQVIVFGDENSKRNVSAVVRLEVE